MATLRLAWQKYGTKSVCRSLKGNSSRSRPSLAILASQLLMTYLDHIDMTSRRIWAMLLLLGNFSIGHVMLVTQAVPTTETEKERKKMASMEDDNHWSEAQIEYSITVLESKTIPLVIMLLVGLRPVTLGMIGTSCIVCYQDLSLSGISFQAAFHNAFNRAVSYGAPQLQYHGIQTSK